MEKLRRRSLNVFLALSVFLCGALVCAEEFKTGDVIVARKNVPLRLVSRTTDHVTAGQVLQVQFVRDHWLWVTYRQSGYIRASDVMGSEEAEAEFSRRILGNPADVVTRRARGYVRLLTGNVDGALADFSAMLSVTTSPLFFSDRGTAWFSKGQYDRALADFNRAILHQGTPRLAKLDRADLYCGRGLALLSAGAIDKAIHDFDVAIATSEGKLATAYYRRGLAFLSQGNANERAIADLNRAIQRNRLDVAAINARGLAWLRLGMFTKAADDFRNVISKSPDKPFVSATKSDLLYGQLVTSDDWPSNVTRQISPSDSAYYNLAILLAAGPDDVRDSAEARLRAEQVCRLDKNRYYAFQEALAAAYAAADDFENARERQRKAIALAPEEKLKEALEQALVNYDDGRVHPFLLGGPTKRT
jgi:tetratricopeptide (TPR) repeat protein